MQTTPPHLSPTPLISFPLSNITPLLSVSFTIHCPTLGSHPQSASLISTPIQCINITTHLSVSFTKYPPSPISRPHSHPSQSAPPTFTHSKCIFHLPTSLPHPSLLSPTHIHVFISILLNVPHPSPYRSRCRFNPDSTYPSLSHIPHSALPPSASRPCHRPRPGHHPPPPFSALDRFPLWGVRL